ncbi:3-hydroxyacyl-CoA dehydrogenase NAD-binding domain-containing protein [Chitinophaga barathri]|uniref:3-hydroxybutyryl-CoA dehydrogenase n=1 Tax=Chitinophaga barathri TaxID=1647451 RepID=A0A3N4MSU2_9BACT|nr:3-hydroxyacyl-CoA dehydrogenase NAD-binding domain-containing protein [Chitinophaga barathri]RPD38483.1 3-hydroxybutyryl-CoA dehydrogenase [Chitinophaga barathri]
MQAVQDIKVIAVCGAGTMGAGIAQVSAAAGFHTRLFDLDEKALQQGYTQIRGNLQKAVDKGKMPQQQMTDILARLTLCNDMAECKANVVIEAIVEKIDVKVSLFNQLAAINQTDTIFASNTSSLSVTEIARQVAHPGRVAGMHFFNPAHLMQLVEVVSGEQTTPHTARLLYALTMEMGKTPVRVKDSPGFIVNRVARHYYLEAMEAVEAGNADISATDRLLEAAGFRMGPFALMDLIGNDVNYAVTVSLYEAFERAPRFKPGAMQAALVAKGELGRKTGKGFYNY